MATIYPFAFAQNTITTGMIAFKIWRQHRSSTELGVLNHSPLDLIGVMRIVIESAMIYTFQLLILIILFPVHHNAQLIVQCAIVPSIGEKKSCFLRNSMLILDHLHRDRLRLDRCASTVLPLSDIAGRRYRYGFHTPLAQRRSRDKFHR